jgi:hypothetical protein
MKNIPVLSHASAAIIVTVIFLFIYASVQQSYRTAANDPQMQLASEIKQRLENGQSIQNFFPNDSVDLSKSFNVFAMLLDNQCHVMRSSGFLHGENPILPKGVFDFVKTNGEDRVTWQPQPNVRMAMVIMKINADSINYVAVGRSLKEVEVRESDLLFMTFVGWIICIAVISINAVIYFFMKSKKIEFRR